MGRFYFPGPGTEQEAPRGTSQRNPNSESNAAPNDAADFFCEPIAQEAVFTPDKIKLSWKSCLDKFLTCFRPREIKPHVRQHSSNIAHNGRKPKVVHIPALCRCK